MLETDVIDRIRHIFLHPRPHVSISQATSLLGWTWRRMNDAIAAGDVELMTTPIGKWFWRHELMSKALETWPLDVIEEALGDDADGVLPQAIRTKELRVRLPRHHVDMLEYRAEQGRPRSAVFWPGSLTASPAPTRTSSRPRFRDSPRRWRGLTGILRCVRAESHECSSVPAFTSDSSDLNTSRFHVPARIVRLRSEFDASSLRG